MIQRFSARVLDSLSRLYQIVGPISRVDSLDVSPPVLVHDVSREAEAAAGFPTAIAQVIDTVGAAATVFALTTRDEILATSYVSAELEKRGLNASDVDVWWTGASSLSSAATAGNFSGAQAGIRFGTISGTGIVRTLKRWTGSAGAMISGGAESAGSSLPDQDLGPLMLPLLLPDDTDTALLGRATSGAGGQLIQTVYHWLYICPRGTMPQNA